MNGFSGGAQPSPFDYKGGVAQIKKIYISEAKGLKFTLSHAALKIYYAASYLLYVKEECLKLGIYKAVV